MSENTPAKKAAASRGAASQSPDSAPTNRQASDTVEQQNAAATSADEERLKGAVEAAEAAAQRAEELADKTESALAEIKEFIETLVELDVGGVDQSERSAKKTDAVKEPEIGSRAWQKKNRLAALEEEMGFAKAKDQTSRVRDIQSEIDRVKQG